MGTASFSIGKYARTKGNGAASLLASIVRTSGAFTTSTTAANLEDASGDVTAISGDVVRIYADEAMRVSFGGAAATASTGHYIPAATTFECEVEDSGLISIIDVA